MSNMPNPVPPVEAKTKTKATARRTPDGRVLRRKPRPQRSRQPKSSDPTVQVSIYRGARDPQPAQQDDLSWLEFCDEVEAALLLRTADKCDMLAVGPYRLREGTTRAASNVAEMAGLIALDLDAVSDLDGLLAGLRGAEIAALVHTTPSDPGPGNTPRKVRVYLQSEPHPPGDCARIRRAAATLLGQEFDQSTCNAKLSIPQTGSVRAHGTERLLRQLGSQGTVYSAYPPRPSSGRCSVGSCPTTRAEKRR